MEVVKKVNDFLERSVWFFVLAGVGFLALALEHYTDGEPIPLVLVDIIIAILNFLSAIANFCNNNLIKGRKK